MTGFAIPITTLYVGLNALIILWLAVTVVRQRQATGTALGMVGGEDDRLERACRAHANATEYIPVALILILVLELMGSFALLLHGLGLLLTIARLLHAQGLLTSRGATRARILGTIMTFTVYGIGALSALVTAFSAVWVPGPQ